MKPFLSLCMIVKNEEKVLMRCLDSVKDIVDEIIIVDTGSTDLTKKIASDYTELIYEFEWTDSFADARNFAKLHANGEWILVLDADEYVDTNNLIDALQELRSFEEMYEAIEVKIYNFAGYRGERIVQHRSLRIYKNNPSIGYYRTIHEQIGKKDGELIVGSSKLILYHSGYLKGVVQEKNKNERNQHLLNKEMTLSGNTAFDYFNLGNEYQSQGKLQKALDAYLKAYQHKPDFAYSWVSFCLVQIINCLINLNRYDEALKVIIDAEKIYIHSPEFSCLKAIIYLRQHRYDDTIYELENLLKNKEKFQNFVTSIDFLEYHPHILLGNVYEINNNNENAVYHYVKALSINNVSSEALFNLISILSKNCSNTEVYHFIEKQNWIKTQQDIYSIIRILLNLNQVSLAEKYFERLENDNIVKKGFQLKISLINGNLEDITQFINNGTLENLYEITKYNGLDLYDLIIYGLLSKRKNFLILLSNIVGNDDKSFIHFILEASSDPIPNDEYYINLLERCIQFRQFELFESIVNKRHQQGMPPLIDLSIGHLLHKHGLNQLAIDFYNEVGIDKFDKQGFINIITDFLDKSLNNEALEFILLALEREITDFRLFKFGIELLDKKNNESDKERLLKIALDYYPDSNWLKDMFIFG